jgi:hypothetical protein
MNIDKRLLGVFIPCTQDDLYEVFTLLFSAGLFNESWTTLEQWEPNSIGMQTDEDGYFAPCADHDNLPTLTIEQLRQIVHA